MLQYWHDLKSEEKNEWIYEDLLTPEIRRPKRFHRRMLRGKTHVENYVKSGFVP